MEFRAISKVDLCKKARIDRMSLDKYLAAEVSAGLDKIESLANALEVTPEGLIADAALDKIDPLTSAKAVREHLRILAEKEGLPWPPSIDFLAKILR